MKMRTMNFLEMAALATACLRLRSSGLIPPALEGAPTLALVVSTEATCALMCASDSLCCFRLSRYSDGARMAHCWCNQTEK